MTGIAVCRVINPLGDEEVGGCLDRGRVATLDQGENLNR